VVLMGLAEGLGLPGLGVHAIGLALLVGRLAHAWGLSQTPHILRLRVIGVAATTLAMLAGAVACLALALMH